jgi:conjugative transfer signal peptidase TraF
MSRGVAYPPRVHRRRCAIAVSITGALMMATLVAGEAAGLRINATASMPCGLWRVRAGEPIEGGEIVTICPPDRPDIREAAHRGYIPSGSCPGGYEPLVKPIAAVAGDVVTVTPQGIAVDDRPVANTAPLAEDEAGRKLHPIPIGAYRVAPGEVWLLSGHDPRSFDSRYFGAVPVANVQGVARALWVLW